MIDVTSLLPIIIGISAGLLYGYSFVSQQRSIFFQSNWARAISLFIGRMLLALYFSLYLLRSPQIPSILGLLGFVSVFWSILLLKKVKPYERC